MCARAGAPGPGRGTCSPAASLQGASWAGGLAGPLPTCPRPLPHPEQCLLGTGAQLLLSLEAPLFRSQGRWGWGSPCQQGQDQQGLAGGRRRGRSAAGAPVPARPGRVAPVVTENKEVALGGGTWASWSRFQGWKVLLMEGFVVSSSFNGYFC